MVTAVDTNVLLDVFLDDIEYRQPSFDALTAAFSAGDVIVSDVVWAETGAAFENNATFEQNQFDYTSKLEYEHYY